MNSYLQSKKHGDIAEKFVIELFKNIGCQCEGFIQKNSFYDMSINYGLNTFHIEVKFDRMSDSTKNLAIEYWNPKKNVQSGITTSKADFWVYCFNSPLEAHFVALKDLLRYINENKPIRIVEKGGDDNASLLLYDRDSIISSIFWRIDNLDEESFKSGLNLFLDERLKNFNEKGLKNAS